MRKLQYVVVLLVVVSLSLGAVIGMGCGGDKQYTIGISQIVLLTGLKTAWPRKVTLRMIM